MKEQIIAFLDSRGGRLYSNDEEAVDALVAVLTPAPVERAPAPDARPVVRTVHPVIGSGGPAPDAPAQ